MSDMHPALSRRQLSPARPGITVVEVLIVVAIILTLVGITLGAISAFRSGTTGSAAVDVPVSNMASAIDVQLKSLIDANRRNDVSAYLPAAGQDRRKARVLMLKDVVRKQFPQSFAEAAANPVYAAAIGPQPLVIPGVTAANEPLQPFVESAICLYLALQRSQGGNAGQPEAMSSGNLKTIQTNNGLFLSYLADPSGLPFAFIREPSGNTELADKKYAGAVPHDPLDPEMVIQPLPAPNPNIIPVVFAAGTDKGYGVTFPAMATAPGAAAGYSLDNVYSYRLRQSGARGN